MYDTHMTYTQRYPLPGSVLPGGGGNHRYGVHGRWIALERPPAGNKRVPGCRIDDG